MTEEELSPDSPAAGDEPSAGPRMILMRHGQIRANKVGRWHGSTDSPLTWKGRRQAARTGRHLFRNEEIHAVYCSPLVRCRETAVLASRRFDLPVLPVDGLQEMSIGAWEDMTFRDLINEYDFLQRSVADPDFKAPGGESLNQVALRTTAALRHIESLHDSDETVLVVSHGVAMAVAVASFINGTCTLWGEYHFNNCSLTDLLLSPEPVLQAFNQYAHL